MNSLKPLFTIAVLGLVSAAVYVVISRPSRDGLPPPEVAPYSDGAAQNGAPLVQFGEAGSGGPPSSLSGGQTARPFHPDRDGSRSAAAGAPSYGSGGAGPGQGDEAPPFNASDHDRPGPPSRRPAGEDNTSQPPPAEEAAPAFETLMEEVHRQLEDGRLADAHLALGRFYRRPGLTPEQSTRVVDLLDQLAGTVIYSREHHIEPPYVVRSGETLEDIADQYEVPWQLLANINRIDDPHHLQPGEELKVVRGPFRAVVRLEDHELTMMLGERYAGRFAVGVGHDVPPEQVEGTYQVAQKTVGPAYRGPDGLRFPKRDPRNPLGGRRLALSRPDGQPTPVALHGTNNPSSVGGSCERGTICLGDRDIQDVYGILSVGSRVVVRR